ncbi:MAG: glutamate-5-semialdehyde dehydrogenase [Planctomycetes bacterium]|nr:glutamate-5-semialdehyde dehydrogenase [Planctomycetota bacterium]
MTEEQVQETAKAAQAAAAEFRKSGLSKRKAFYVALARLLEENREAIKSANAQDLAAAQANQLSDAMMDRLTLGDGRIDDLIQAVGEIELFEDPLGASEGRRLENGLMLQKVSVGIGVVGFIYESRPNVTIDAVALCVKSGNAVILKGGKEAIYSNEILSEICIKALKEVGLPEGLVSLLDCSDRAMVGYLVRQEGLVDLVIPRGGHGLIRRVVEESLVPVIKHDAGNCHIYVEETANQAEALEIIRNAKTQRPGVCNALESLVVDESIAAEFLPKLKEALADVELRLCEKSLKYLPEGTPATADDFYTEYLGLILSVKSVSGLDEAVNHVQEHSSGHTEAILTQSLKNSELFLQQVDSAVVLCNASTRFSDGGQFGLGAEIGISTDRLHARGPMGAAQMTTYKYVVRGDGQIRG